MATQLTGASDHDEATADHAQPQVGLSGKIDN